MDQCDVINIEDGKGRFNKYEMK